MSDSPSTSYQPLPIRLRPSSNIVRHVYIKAHAGDDSLPKDRTLFVVGLPVELDEGGLLQLFSKYGQVERAAIHGSRLSAVVLYTQSAARKAVMKAAAKGRTVQLDVPPPSGLKGWVEAHKAQKPGNAELQRQLDVWTEEFEAEEERRKAAALAAMEEDGWTVVQRHRGRKKNTSESGTTVGAVAAGAAATQAGKKQTVLHNNFYRFQQRDKRRTGERCGPPVWCTFRV